MDGDWSVGQWVGPAAGIVTALGGLVIGVRKFLTWLCGRQDQQIASLAHDVAALKRELRETNGLVFTLGRAIVRVLPDLPPGSAAREMVEKALHRAFPTDFDTPGDLLARLAEMDRE